MKDMPAVEALLDRVERDCTVRRPPDFVLIRNRMEARRRKALVTAAGTGFGLGIMLASIIVNLLLP